MSQFKKKSTYFFRTLTEIKRTDMNAYRPIYKKNSKKHPIIKFRWANGINLK